MNIKKIKFYRLNIEVDTDTAHYICLNGWMAAHPVLVSTQMPKFLFNADVHRFEWMAPKADNPYIVIETGINCGKTHGPIYNTLYRITSDGEVLRIPFKNAVYRELMENQTIDPGEFCDWLQSNFGVHSDALGDLWVDFVSRILHLEDKQP